MGRRGVGLLVLVTILVEMILVWFNLLSPEYCARRLVDCISPGIALPSLRVKT
jgi:hypothetical protein